MQRTLIASLAVLACAVLLLSIAPALSPVAGQTIPPMPPVSTPGGPTSTPDPDGCWKPYCAPPVQTPSWVATPTPQVEPGDGNAPGGPGIINTPNPAAPMGLPDMAYLHFLPMTTKGR